MRDKRTVAALLGIAVLTSLPSPKDNAEDRPRSRCRAGVDPVAEADVPRDVRENFANGSPVLGSDALWVLIGPLDDVSFDLDRDRWLIRKLPWYRRTEGTLEIAGQRRDGSGSIKASVPGGYPVPGFVPSRIEFSGAGCWKITARLADSTVRFTVRVPRGLSAMCDSVDEQLEALRELGEVPENRVTLERFEAAAREKGCRTG